MLEIFYIHWVNIYLELSILVHIWKQTNALVVVALVLRTESFAHLAWVSSLVGKSYQYIHILYYQGSRKGRS